MFFPVTIVIIVACGIALVIPCYVSNALILVKTRNCDDQNHYEKVSADISKKVYRLYGIIAIVFIAANFAYSAALNMQIAGRIQESSGYAPGSPDYVVLKNYYYSEETEDYKNLDYDYTVVKSALFILAKKNSMCKSDIIFAMPNGRFPEKNRYNMSGGSRGSFMREDIRKCFSEIKVANVGSQFAYMLIADLRSDEQRAADWSETFNTGMEDAYLSIGSLDDKSHINVDELRLVNHKGVSPKRIQISGGEYVAYCDSFSKEDKDYSLTVYYRGELALLLTYDDIVHFKVTVSHD